MAINIKYVRIGELESFLESDHYSSQSFHPISIPRALSHENNPRGRRSDVALLLAFDGDKLVGYLGAVPEWIYLNEKPEKVCWYSCMWVLPEYRRSGIAGLLLEDAGKHYNNRVLISNYIPRSKAAFLKNDQFSEVVVLKGVRAYLRADLAKILIRKSPSLRWMKFELKIANTLINLLAGIVLRRTCRRDGTYRIEPTDQIAHETDRLIRYHMQGSLFRRGTAEFRWLAEHPWVVTHKPEGRDISKYYFSQYDPEFRQWQLLISNEKGIRGFAILTKHKGELKTPYILTDGNAMPALLCHILDLMKREKIHTLVTHHAGLVSEVKRRRRAFLFRKSSEYGFMATPEVVELVKGEFGQMYEGDGDGMFT